MVPHIDDSEKLGVVKYALEKANYDPTVAGPISNYLLKYLDQSPHKIVIAKSVLIENANDPLKSETAMQGIEGDVAKSSGREEFKAEYKKITGKSGEIRGKAGNLTANEAKKMSDEKVRGLKKLFPSKTFSSGSSTEKKGNRDKIKEAKEIRLNALDEEEAAINKMIADFTAANPGTSAINWCLREAKSSKEDLKTLIAFVESSIVAAIPFSELETLVVNKEQKLWPLIRGMDGGQRGELPAQIKRMTLSGLAEIFTKTANNWTVTKNILAAVQLEEENTFLGFLKTWNASAITHLATLLQKFDLKELTTLKKKNGDEAKIVKLFITDSLDVANTKTLLTKTCQNKVVELLEKVAKPDLLVKLEGVSGGSIDELERMVDQLNADNSKVIPVETSLGGVSPADSMLKVAIAGKVNMRDTPSGKITPASGNYSGTELSYGDNRNKHCKLGLYEAEDIEANIAPLRHDTSYGSQLSKAATDGYGDLVKEALESGAQDGPTKYTHTAGYYVGVNVITGLKTMNYAIYYSYNYGGWHVSPDN